MINITIGLTGWWGIGIASFVLSWWGSSGDGEACAGVRVLGVSIGIEAATG